MRMQPSLQTLLWATLSPTAGRELHVSIQQAVSICPRVRSARLAAN